LIGGTGWKGDMARIYVADDDPDITKVIKYALTDEGHDVTAFTDGAAARTAAMATPPDLLILDVMMPELDGFQVLDMLRNSRARASIRILVLTARASEIDWSRAYKLGADGFMTKPFDPDELAATVAELLAMPEAELKERKERERDKAHLLSQFERILGDY
jgi:DNA-binding response OmpR family regulator